MGVKSHQNTDFFGIVAQSGDFFNLHFLVSASILAIGTIQTGCDTILI